MKKNPINSLEEIELAEMLRIIWKRRYLIIAGTLIITCVTATISFLMPKVYTVGMVIQPGFLTVTSHGKKSYIDTVENIKEVIETGELSNKIYEESKNTKGFNAPEPLRFKVRIQRKSNIVKVMNENKDRAKGLKALNQLKDMLLLEYGELVKYYQTDYNIKIKLKSVNAEELDIKIFKAKKDIDLLNIESVASIKKINEELSFLNEKINLNKIDISNLQKRREEFQKSIRRVGKVDIIRDIDNQIDQKQTEIDYFEKRKRDLDEEKINTKLGTKFEIENLKSTMATLENQKKSIFEEIQFLEYKRNSIQNIQIIQNPETRSYPVKPKVLLNTVLAFLSGIFLMVFLTYLLETRKKNK